MGCKVSGTLPISDITHSNRGYIVTNCKNGMISHIAINI